MFSYWRRYGNYLECHCTLCRSNKKQYLDTLIRCRLCFKSTKNYDSEYSNILYDSPLYLKSTCFGYDWYFTTTDINLNEDKDFNDSDVGISISESSSDTESDNSEKKMYNIQKTKNIKNFIRNKEDDIKNDSDSNETIFYSRKSEEYDLGERCYVFNCFFHRGPMIRHTL